MLGLVSYRDIIQMVNVELRNGFLPKRDFDGLGLRGVWLDQHHPQVLVHLHSITHLSASSCYVSREVEGM